MAPNQSILEFVRKLILCLLLCFLGSTDVSQARTEVTALTGPLLIAGASQNIQQVGATFTLGIEPEQMVELTGLTGSKSGVSYHLGSLGWRRDFLFYDISTFFLLGLDLHYKRFANESRFSNHAGFHMGFGFSIRISKNFYLRNDYRLRYGFRDEMNALFGISYAISEGGIATTKEDQ